jgi:hypothetical protein
MEIQLTADIEAEEGAEQLSGRKCGECSLCCYVLSVPEIDKPAHSWCKHCRPGQGCTIYATRPQRCRGFVCNWLIDKSIPEYWFPKRARIVIRLRREDDQLNLRLEVDHRFPNRWREEPYYSDIRRLALVGLKGEKGFRFSTRIHVGEREYLVLPHREIDLSEESGVVVQMGKDEFEFFRAKSKADAERLTSTMKQLREMRRRNPALAAEMMTTAINEMIAESPSE